MMELWCIWSYLEWICGVCGWQVMCFGISNQLNVCRQTSMIEETFVRRDGRFDGRCSMTREMSKFIMIQSHLNIIYN